MDRHRSATYAGAVEITVDSLIADPPPVHGGGAPDGVWATDRDCYEFLWQNTVADATTLETGCGVSTAVFAVRGARHMSVFLDEQEGAIFKRWADSRDINLDKVELRWGGSDVVLPTLAPGALDLVFIDGNHGFPMPILDWFYSCSHLKQGGLLVVDDVQIPGVQRLTEYLDHDDRWQPERRGVKWKAYRRLAAGSLSENWWPQKFLPEVRASDVALIARARAYAHPWRTRGRAIARTIRRP